MTHPTIPPLPDPLHDLMDEARRTLIECRVDLFGMEYLTRIAQTHRRIVEIQRQLVAALASDSDQLVALCHLDTLDEYQAALTRLFEDDPMGGIV
jgi:hypothetical protein